MAHLLSQFSPRARLFEYLRQETVAQDRAHPSETDAPGDVITAIQRAALRSLDRSAH